MVVQSYALQSGLKDPILRATRDVVIEMVHLRPAEAADLHNQTHQISCISDEFCIKSRLSWKGMLDAYGRFMDRHFETIRLESNLLLVWNLLNYFTIFVLFNESLFTVFIISIAQEHRHFDLTSQHVFKGVLFLILLVDSLAVRYRVRIVISGRVVTAHSQLMRHYLTRLLLLDVIALGVLLVDIVGEDLRISKLLFVCKVVGLIQLDKQIFYKLMGHHGVIVFVKFFRMVFIIAYFTFFFACGFVTIELEYLYEGGYYQQNGFLWLTSSPKLHYVDLYSSYGWEVWFEYALFAVMQMCTGCGYGTPSPQTPLGAFWYNLSTITTKIAFAYFCKRVVEIFLDFFHNQDYLVLGLRRLSLLHRQHHQESSDRLFGLVEGYINRTQLAKEHDIQVVELTFPDLLSAQLLPKFRECYRKHFLMRFYLLDVLLDQDLDDPTFIVQFSQIIKTRNLLEGEIIFHSNQIGPQILYLCELQTIQVRAPSLNHDRLEAEWSWAGVREFFISKKSLFEVAAVRPELVEYINKAEFMALLKRYPSIYQKYCEHLDLVKHSRATTKFLDLRCWRCNEFHLAEHCEFFKYGTIKIKDRRRSGQERQMAEQGRRQFKRNTAKEQKTIGWKVGQLHLDHCCHTEGYFHDHNFLF